MTKDKARYGLLIICAVIALIMGSIQCALCQSQEDSCAQLIRFDNRIIMADTGGIIRPLRYISPTNAPYTTAELKPGFSNTDIQTLPYFTTLKLKIPKVRYVSSLDDLFWVSMAYSVAGGFVHGSLEAYRRDGEVFERRFKVGQRSWLGSECTDRNYWENNPETGQHKHELFGNFGRDFKHTFTTLDYVFAVTPVAVLGLRDQPRWHRVLNIVIAGGVRTLVSYGTYKIMSRW